MKLLRFILVGGFLYAFTASAQCPTTTQINGSNYTVTGTNCSVTAAQVNQGFNLDSYVLIIAEGASLTINGNFTIYDQVRVLGTLIVNGNVTANSVGGVSTVYVGSNGNFNVNGNYTNGTENILGIPGTAAQGTTNVDGNMSVSGTYTNNDGGTTTVSNSGTLQSGTFDDQGGSVTIDGVSDPTDCEDGCCGSGCSALPVVLIDFQVFEINGTAQLNWTTAQELDNDYFIISKMEHGQQEFVEIGQVNGKGTTTKLSNYQFTDDWFTKDSYYQITQVDFDGQRETFGPVVLPKAFLDELNISLHPNPTSGAVSVLGTGYTGFTMYSIQGEVIRHEPNRIGQEAESLINQTLSSKSGTFFIAFHGLNKVVTKRIVKL
ncbi:hypothetical protein [Marinoscillum sp.]|uniref:hypothetical protein n=1 Tax=Marinoscillum sp. TaxID=2024838 RepID=UPI003BA850D8